MDNGAMSFTEGSEPIKLTDEKETENPDLVNEDVRTWTEGYIAGANAEIERMNKLYSTSKESFLAQTSFKNVSGNWQFNGSITPERVFQVIARQLKEERNKAIQWCINSVNNISDKETLLKKLESLKSDSK